MAISDWPAAERPREKLLQRGAQALSDAELLAIFLRTGLPGVSAVDLANSGVAQVRTGASEWLSERAVCFDSVTAEHVETQADKRYGCVL